MDYKKYRSIELVFENTDSVVIPGKQIKSMVFTDITKSMNIAYQQNPEIQWDNRLFMYNTAQFALLYLTKEAGETLIPSDALPESTWESLNKRLRNIDDITSITVNLRGSEKYNPTVYLPDSECNKISINPVWNWMMSDETNDYQHNFITPEQELIIAWIKMPAETINYHFNEPYGMFTNIRQASYPQLMDFLHHAGLL